METARNIAPICGCRLWPLSKGKSRKENTLHEKLGKVKLSVKNVHRPIRQGRTIQETNGKL
jgi:hypothetical protein